MRTQSRSLNKEMWDPFSWQNYPYTHLPTYEDLDSLQSACKTLSKQRALISDSSVRSLKNALQKCHEEKAFILHLGDCAEAFVDADPLVSLQKIQVLHLLRARFEKQVSNPVILIARMAGQYAKPRTQFIEMKHGTFLNSYFGDLFNSASFSPTSRSIDASRLMQAYESARSVFASIEQVERQNKTFFASHEALNLHYEACLTRKVGGAYYNLSTHLPWLGLRTGVSSPAHWHYLKGIENPIGIKVGQQTDPDHLISLIKLLNPTNQIAKIVLIHRFGEGSIKSYLSSYIRAIENERLNVIWMCDPVHGNTEILLNVKVRRVEKIVREIKQAFKIHKEYGTCLSGIHLEHTHEMVTECVDDHITEDRVLERYLATVDPRLNPEQVGRILDSVASFVNA